MARGADHPSTGASAVYGARKLTGIFPRARSRRFIINVLTEPFGDQRDAEHDFEHRQRHERDEPVHGSVSLDVMVRAR